MYGNVSGNDLPLWVAADGGIFQQNGLDVDLEYVTSGNVALAALLSGQIQIEQGSGADAVLAATQGADVEVAAQSAAVYDYELMAAPSIQTAQDLKGKSLSDGAPGSSPDNAMRSALQSMGLDPSADVVYIQVPDAGARASALLSGAVQGAIVTPPGNIALQQAGFHVLLDLAGQGIMGAQQSTLVQRSFATASRATVQSYVDSLIEATARIRSDRAFSLQVLKKYFKSDDDQAMNAVYDFYVNEVINPRPLTRPEAFQNSIQALAVRNPQVQDVDLSTIIDNSFVQSALDRHLDQAP